MKRDGLPRAGAVNLDNLAAIPTTWLQSRIAPLRPEKLQQLDRALRSSHGIT